MKYLKYTREILIIGLVLFVILLFVKPCGKAKQLEAYRILQAHAKTLEAKVKADSIARNEERKAYEAEKKDAEGKRQLAEVEKGEADNKVRQQQKTIDRLAAIVRKENNSLDNVPVWQVHKSGGVVVSKEFKAACDSLPAQIDLLNLALADKDSSINGIIDLYNYEIQIRDEELFKEMNYSDSLKVDFVRQTKLLRSALQQCKPRGRLLGGISIMGNQNQFLSGAGVVLAYQSKGGKQYQVSPKFIKVPGSEAEVFYEGSVLFTIFK